MKNDKEFFLFLGKRCPTDALEVAQECPDGEYQDNPGETACLSCTAGHECSNKTLSPVQCDAGYYAPERSLSCTLCPTGKVRSGVI